MMSLWQASWVIARRDFAATVYSRSFIIFMIAPVIFLGLSALGGVIGARSAKDNTPVVAVVADSATAQALDAARTRLANGTSERTFPKLKLVQPAEDVRAQARVLIADQQQGLSAVFSGTLDRPLLSGPPRIDESVGGKVALIVETAQRDRALAAGTPMRAPLLERDVTGEAAGNVRDMRQVVARFGPLMVFMFSVMLATMLLSNLVEEKSNKVMEILAASIPLDAVFYGKLMSMLAVSFIGIALWVGVAGLGVLFSAQLLPAGVEVPPITPAVGWPVYILLLLVYFMTNYLLLGTLFMSIGGQANSIKEMQSLNMPVVILQLATFFLSMTVINSDGGLWPWIAYIFPFSSPLAMTAEAGQSSALWPHLLAIPWQLLWVFLTVRIAVALFRKTVMKSGGREPIFRLRRRKAVQPAE